MLSRRMFAQGAAAAGVCASWTARGLTLPGAQSTTATAPATEFSVMMWALAKHGSFEENLQRVAAAGYHYVELVNEPKGWSAAERDRIVARMRALHLAVDAMAGLKLGFGDPGKTEAFLADLKSVLEMARRFNCQQIILVSGPRLPGVSDETQRAACVHNLKRAAELLEQAGIMGVIEPIDRLENPPIYLDGVTEAFEIVRAVGSPHVKVLYDFFHEQRTHGNLLEKLEGNIDEIGLIHVADVPGRHEPGTGEVNFCDIYRRLAELHYRGRIAMEFYPTGDVVSTLRTAREQAVRCMARL